MPNHSKNQKNLNKLFTEIGVKFEFSAQRSDLAPFVSNGTKVKAPSEIKPPLLFARNCNLPKPITRMAAKIIDDRKALVWFRSNSETGTQIG